MASFEHEFLLEPAVSVAREESLEAPLSFEEEWERFQDEERRLRASGQAALFDVVLVDGEVKANVSEV